MAETTYYTAVLSSVAGANKRHLAVFNAAGSGMTMRLNKLKASGAPVAAVTGLIIALHAVRITAAPTGGTSPGFGKALTVSANPPGQVTVMAAATGGATESGPPFGCATVSGEEAIAANTDPLYKSDLDGTEPMTFVEGEGFLVKQGALASAGAVTVVAELTLG